MSDIESAEETPEDLLGSDEAPALRARLQSQSEELDQALRALSRLQQDKDDFRRRAEREKERVLAIERGNVSQALIEAIDQLDLSLSALPERAQCQGCGGLQEGVRLIRAGLLRQLEHAGITRVSASGATFDPTRHEAVESVRVSDPALDGQALSEIRSGYLQGDRVLRPARVRVGSYLSPGNN